MTPTKLFSKSGPVTCSLFRETPLNSAAALKTTLTFPGLLTFVTARWGRYHVFLGCMFASSSDSFLAYPLDVAVHGVAVKVLLCQGLYLDFSSCYSLVFASSRLFGSDGDSDFHNKLVS